MRERGSQDQWKRHGVGVAAALGRREAATVSDAVCWLPCGRKGGHQQQGRASWASPRVSFQRPPPTVSVLQVLKVDLAPMHWERAQIPPLPAASRSPRRAHAAGLEAQGASVLGRAICYHTKQHHLTSTCHTEVSLKINVASLSFLAAPSHLKHVS